MKRAVAASALLVFAAGCQSSRPRVATGGLTPDFLGAYVGQQRVLRFQGDRERITVKRRDPVQLPGACDVAVQVRTAVLERGEPVLALDTLGTVGAEKARPRCQRVPRVVTVRFLGFEGEGAAVRGRVEQILPLPEEYLRAYGVVFDAAPGEEPSLAAARESRPDTSSEERRLGHRVTTWPRRLFWVDPIHRNPRVRHQGEVEFEAVVGADGRAYRPRVLGSLGPEHVAAVERVLPMWRFEPARAGPEAVPAYHSSRAVLQILE